MGEKMRILCTGGAGYIGSILVPRLLDAGHSVIVLDNFLYGANSLATSCLHKRFAVHRCDVRNIDDVKPYLGSADVVIPLAGLVGAPLCDRNPVDAELTNLIAPISMFKALAPDQLVIMPTTESSYGANADICTEETPLNPLSTYARHKVEVEQALMERSVNSISLRLATVFGMSPRMRLDLLINDFTWRAFKDRAFVVFEGHYRRTSIHITDVARAILHAIQTDAMRSQIYNVGAVSATKLEICAKIKRQVPYFNYLEMQAKPKDSFGHDPDQRNYQVSDAKIRATGYEPNITLERGIAELLMGYRMLSNIRYGNLP
jgi:nucleoside-diphosphate-sugar epimerase